jgi:hypothetical protein
LRVRRWWVAATSAEMHRRRNYKHIETTHAVDLVGRPGFGYLLKDRVLEVEEFLLTAGRVAAGGSALDPTVVGKLVALTAGSPLARLSDRERAYWS